MQNKILQQTKIPITIPYIHSINIYKHNNIILESTLLPCAQTEISLTSLEFDARYLCSSAHLAYRLNKSSQARAALGHLAMLYTRYPIVARRAWPTGCL